MRRPKAAALHVPGISPLYYTGLYRARFCPLSPGVQNPDPHLPGQVLCIRVDPQAEGVGEVGGLYPHPGQATKELWIAWPFASVLHITFPQAGFHLYQVLNVRFPIWTTVITLGHFPPPTPYPRWPTRKTTARILIFI